MSLMDIIPESFARCALLYLEKEKVIGIGFPWYLAKTNSSFADAIVKLGFANSKSEARNKIKQKSVSFNDFLVDNTLSLLKQEEFWKIRTNVRMGLLRCGNNAGIIELL